MSNINDFYGKLKNKEKVFNFNSEFNSEANYYVLKNDTNSFTIKRRDTVIESLDGNGVNTTNAVRLIFDEDSLTATNVFYEQNDSRIENLEFTSDYTPEGTENKKINNIKRKAGNTELNVTSLNLGNTGTSGKNIIYSGGDNIFGINVTDNTLSYNNNQSIEYDSSGYTLKIITDDFKEKSGKDIFHFTDKNKTVYFKEVKDGDKVGFEYDSSKNGTIVKFHKIIETKESEVTNVNN